MALGNSSTRLGSLRISGGKASATLADALLSARIKLSATSVSEIEFEFADTASGYLARQSFLRGGTVSYSGWQFTVTDVDQQADGDGMTGKVVAASKAINALKKQTGAKKWGKVNRRSWAAARAKSVGMKLTAPQLGTGQMMRKKVERGKDSESSWDLLHKLAKDRSALIFEFGKRLVIGSPAWLVSNNYGGRDVGLWWHNKTTMHQAIVNGPTVSWGESSTAGFELALTLLAPDAYLIRPGDTIRFSKKSPMMYRGPWLITDVELDAARDSGVQIKAVRAYRIEREELKFETAKKKPKPKPKAKAPKRKTAKYTSKRKSTNKSVSSTKKKSKGNNSRRAVIENWAAQYNGRSIDYDGGYGAQCVDGFKMYHARFVGGGTIRGNGKDNVNNAVASGLYSRVSVSTMQAGDVISWGSSWGRGYGHVGVALGGASGGKARVWSQLNGVCRTSTLSMSGVVGVARPRRFKA